MRRNPLITTLLMFLLAQSLLPGVLRAAEVSGLYEAEVSVLDRGKESRQQAMAAALEQVLVKVSGQSSPGLLLGPELLQRNAPRYVLQYRYRNIEAEAEEAEPKEAESLTPEPASDTLALWVRFDQAGVDALLREHELPVWGAARPMTLVWLAVERQGRRYLVGANDQGPSSEALKAAAEVRALPLSLPLLDLADQGQVQVVDVWGGFEDAIEAASQRYPAQALLIGRLEAEVPGEYRARWSLSEGDQRWHWESNEFTFEALVASGVNGAAEQLSQRFVEGFQLSSGPVAIEVSALDNLLAYRRAVDYLTALHGVTRVRVSRVSADTVSFLLDVDGSRDNVVQTIGLGHTLVPDNSEAGSMNLRYRLLP